MPKGVAQPRLAARVKKRAIEQIEELLKRGEPKLTAAKTVAGDKASYPDRLDGTRPFSADSAKGWLNPATKQTILAKADKEPVSDSQYAQPEQQEPELAAPGLTKERTKASNAATKMLREQTEEGTAKKQAYAQSETRQASLKESGHKHSKARREDNLQRDTISSSLATKKPVAEVWRLGRTAAELIFEIIRARDERLRQKGENAAVYTGISTARTFGGRLPGDGEQVSYGEGWGGWEEAKDSPTHKWEERRHFYQGDSLKLPGTSGLSADWCDDNLTVFAVKLPDKACLKVAETWLHTLIFRHIRSLMYEALPTVDFAGLLALETLISAGKVKTEGPGYLFATFTCEGIVHKISESAIELMQTRLGKDKPSDLDLDAMENALAGWTGADRMLRAGAASSSSVVALPLAARGLDLHLVVESCTTDGKPSIHGKFWEIMADFSQWHDGETERGFVVTLRYGSGRGAARGLVRNVQEEHLVFSSLDAAVREAWKRTDRKLGQGRSGLCGPDSTIDKYDLVFQKGGREAPREPAPMPVGKRARVK